MAGEWLSQMSRMSMTNTASGTRIPEAIREWLRVMDKKAGHSHICSLPVMGASTRAITLVLGIVIRTSQIG